MKKLVYLASVLLFTNVALCQEKSWKLIWQDEFNYKGLPDKTKWSFDTAGNHHGWGNNEKQWYTSGKKKNAWVNKGTLKITAVKEPVSGKSYSSARLYTKHTTDWQYGKIEVKAKLPAGKGTWPAIWMLGKNIDSVGWPRCGEIDIMEHVGYMKDSVFATVHTSAYNHVKGTQKTKGIFGPELYTAFHTYSIVWTQEKIDFMFDDIIYNSFSNEHKTDLEWPFSQPFFLILNLAIGGNWGGKYGIDEAIFPATMEVDYVRIYQQQ